MPKSKLLLTLLLIVGAASLATAQPATSSSNGSSGFGGGGAPIDGGITLLVAGIAGYGIKKIRDNHKKMSAQKDI